MKYGFVIPAADLAIANTPEIGGESKRAKVSFEEVGLVGEITMSAPTSGTLQMQTNPSFDFDPALGNDLQVRCKVACRTKTDVAVKLAVTFADGSGGTATGLFQIPGYALNQAEDLPMGLTVDLNGDGAGAGKKIKSIGALVSVTGGSRGSTFQVVHLPDVYWDIPGCTRKNETLNVPKALSIAHGLDGSRWTKYGVSEPGRLELEANHISSGDGLQRCNDIPFTCMVEVFAEDRVLKERHVYAECRGAFNTNRGDGDDVVKDTGTAEFTGFFKFV